MVPDQGRPFGNGYSRHRYMRAIAGTDKLIAELLIPLSLPRYLHPSAGGLMSYIKHVLQPGETVRYQGSTHWMLYFPAILLAAASLVTLIVTWGSPQPHGAYWWR
jgi:hypothetical protein